MKFFAVLSLFLAAVNAEYVFNLARSGDGLTVDFTCTFNAENPKGEAIEVRKYTNFLHNSTYTHNVFECQTTDTGADCTATVSGNTCETGYEGEFCRNYGGTDELVSCN